MRTLAGLVGVLAISVGLGGCKPAGAVNAAPAAATLVGERHDGFWWMQVGSQSAAVANFGPTFETQEGRFRQWSLIVYLPGSAEPLSCTQGLVPLAGADAILSKGETFHVQLEPCEGCTWADVHGEKEIVGNALGLY